jgi:hypothetical protein
MHSFEVSLGYESVFNMKMYFGQRFHTPMKLQKNEAEDDCLRHDIFQENKTWWQLLENNGDVLLCSLNVKVLWGSLEGKGKPNNIKVCEQAS